MYSTSFLNAYNSSQVEIPERENFSFLSQYYEEINKCYQPVEESIKLTQSIQSVSRDLQQELNGLQVEMENLPTRCVIKKEHHLNVQAENEQLLADVKKLDQEVGVIAEEVVSLKEQFDLKIGSNDLQNKIGGNYEIAMEKLSRNTNILCELNM